MPRSQVGTLLTLAVLAAAILVGCGDSEIPTKVISGTVTVGGETPDEGHVRFVPIEGTPGPASTAPIVDGQFKIDARGGVPLGKHRVEVQARKKTGRQVQQYNGFEMAMMDETVPLAPPQYGGPQSPLVMEVPSESGDYDIEIPAP